MDAEDLETSSSIRFSESDSFSMIDFYRKQLHFAKQIAENQSPLKKYKTSSSSCYVSINESKAPTIQTNSTTSVIVEVCSQSDLSRSDEHTMVSFSDYNAEFLIWERFPDYNVFILKLKFLLQQLSMESLDDFLDKNFEQIKNRYLVRNNFIHMVPQELEKFNESLPLFFCSWCGLRFARDGLNDLTRQLFEAQIFRDFALTIPYLRLALILGDPELRVNTEHVSLMTLGLLKICKSCQENLDIRKCHQYHCRSETLPSFDCIKPAQARLLARSVPFTRLSHHLGRTWAKQSVLLREIDKTSKKAQREVLRRSAEDNLKFILKFDNNSIRPHFATRIRAADVKDAYAFLLDNNLSYQNSEDQSSHAQFPRNLCDLIYATKKLIFTGESGNRSFITSNPEAETESFPELFPFGCDWRNPPFKYPKHKSNLMTFQDYLERRILGCDFKYIRNKLYIFTLTGEVLKIRLFRNIRYIYEGDEGEEKKKVIIEQLRNLNPQDIPNHPEIKRHFSRLPPTKQYFLGKLRILESLCYQKGPPALFITFSINERNFGAYCTPLIINSTIWGNSANLSSLTDDNHGLSLLYHHKFLKFLLEETKQILINKGIEMDESFFRVEFQMRGTPHAHILLWLKNSPLPLDYICEEQRSECEASWLKLALSLITTDARLIPAHVVSFQTHHCIPTKCDRKQGIKCASHFPRLPLPRALVLNPIANQTPRDVYIARRIVESWKDRILRSTLDKYAHLSQSDEMEEWLSSLNVTEAEYLHTIQRTITTPTFLATRRYADAYINDYNVDMIRLSQSNMDIQIVTSVHNALKYVTKYVSKSEPVKSHIDIHEDTSFNSVMFRSLERHQSRPMSLQECIFTALNLPPIEISARHRWCFRNKDNQLVVGTHTFQSSERSLWRAYLKRSDDIGNHSFVRFLLEWEGNHSRSKKYIVVNSWNTICSGQDQTDQGDLATFFLPIWNADSIKPFSELESSQKLFIEKEMQEIFPFLPTFANKAYLNDCSIEEYEKTCYHGEESIAIDELNSLMPIDTIPRSCIYEEILRSEGPMTSDNLSSSANSDQFLLNVDQFRVAMALIIRLSISNDMTPIYWLISGAGGTGKSLLLKCIQALINAHFIPLPHYDDELESLLDSSQHYVTLAPTGTAASLVNGQTIDGFLKMGYGTENVQKFDQVQHEIRPYYWLMLEEVSMIGYSRFRSLQRAFAYRQEGLFGKASVFALGDFGQLPPVKDTHLLKEEVVVLDEHFSRFDLRINQRAKRDQEFAKFLARFRETLVLQQNDFEILSLRAFNFQAWEKTGIDICLFATNKVKEQFNSDFLLRFPGDLIAIQALNCTGVDINHVVLNLKIGCPLMITDNLDIDSGVTNGSTGIFQGLTLSSSCEYEGALRSVDIKKIIVKMNSNGKIVSIPRKRQARQSGSFSQFPVKLAWGITIHKSQGQTYHKGVGIHCASIKDPAMLYVALSRVTKAADLYLFGLSEMRLSTPKVNMIQELERRVPLFTPPEDDRVAIINISDSKDIAIVQSKLSAFSGFKTLIAIHRHELVSTGYFSVPITRCRKFAFFLSVKGLISPRHFKRFPKDEIRIYFEVTNIKIRQKTKNNLSPLSENEVAYKFEQAIVKIEMNETRHRQFILGSDQFYFLNVF